MSEIDDLPEPRWNPFDNIERKSIKQCMNCGYPPHYCICEDESGIQDVSFTPTNEEDNKSKICNIGYYNEDDESELDWWDDEEQSDEDDFFGLGQEVLNPKD